MSRGQAANTVWLFLCVLLLFIFCMFDFFFFKVFTTIDKNSDFEVNEVSKAISGSFSSFSMVICRLDRAI